MSQVLTGVFFGEDTMATSLKQMVRKQVARVLERGTRNERFDQLRSRHFWSSYLFAYGAGNFIAAGTYDLFKAIPSTTGQGYPTNVPLTTRETNWANNGRVPDNQNFVISEIGVSVIRPPAVDEAGGGGVPANAPTNGIWANLPPATQALIAQNRQIHPDDTANILYGMVLEMQFLTNAVPLGLCADFSQPAGVREFQGLGIGSAAVPALIAGGDATNGVPAAAFRRKLEVPILLQHGETMGMRLNVHRPIDTVDLSIGGAGWAEVRVDWWAHESFAEKS